MSIVACVKVYDGIALGADSATQISGRDPQGNIATLKTYHNANKVFQLQGLPIGILTYGIGNLGNKSIETLLREYNIANPVDKGASYNVEMVSTKLLKYFETLYNQLFSTTPIEQKPVLGFYLAGYSHNVTLGEEFEFLLPRDSSLIHVRPSDQFGASWRGISIPFSRLYFGFDPRIDEKLQQMGRQDLIPIVKTIMRDYSAKVIYDGMPIIDAIKFVEFILRTTIGLSVYEIGFPSCSEPIDLAVIKDGEFKWVRQKKLEI